MKSAENLGSSPFKRDLSIGPFSDKPISVYSPFQLKIKRKDKFWSWENVAEFDSSV
jgi:hypothetical protein